MLKKEVNDGHVKTMGTNTNVLFAPTDFKLFNPYDLSKFKS